MNTKSAIVFGAALSAVCMTAVAGEQEFSSDAWRACRGRAKDRADKEFANEFIIDGQGWSVDLGVPYFESAELKNAFYKKYDATGRLVKTGKDGDFPELQQYFARFKELYKIEREDYAKSIGLTYEEALVLSTNVSKRLLKRLDSKQAVTSEEDKISKVESERAEILSKLEVMFGFRFGQEPVAGAEVRGIREFRPRCNATSQNIVLAVPYRYFSTLQAVYAEGRLCKVVFEVQFDEKYSDEAIEEESAKVRSDIEEKIGLTPGASYAEGVVSRKGSISCWTGVNNKKLVLTFVDSQTMNEVEALHKKNGEPLPTFDQYRTERSRMDQEQPQRVATPSGSLRARRLLRESQRQQEVTEKATAEAELRREEEARRQEERLQREAERAQLQQIQEELRKAHEEQAAAREEDVD